ncbi:hypothetical protein ACFXA2_01675 [Micromonospora chalcea]|uniref:hypothetical protein n=1 Tax=Micromonospora sp. CA-248089 TaxID=3239960 RepID=UPI0036AB5F5B
MSQAVPNSAASRPADPKPRRRRRAASLAASLAVAAGVTLAGPFTATAHAAPIYCGPSDYVEEIQVEPWAGDHFKIKIFPKRDARWHGNPRHVTNSMWHATQACVRGLYGTRADLIYDQLECHQHLALLKDSVGGYKTGPSYDLETWREPFSMSQWREVECGNELNKGVAGAGPVGPAARADAGQTDLHDYYSTIA